MAKNALKL